MSLAGGVLNGSTPPTGVVGEFDYPYVSLYIGLPPGVFGDGAKLYDDSYSWHLRLGLEDIVELRSSLAMLSIPRIRVSDVDRLYECEIGLAVISTKPVDAEARVRKRLSSLLSFDYLLPPMGPKLQAKTISIVGNAKLPRRLEELVFDDVKASQAILELYSYGIDFYTIVRALSIGFLGRRQGRRLVPTRWAITAVDTAIGNRLLSHVRRFQLLSETLVFYAEYLYNRYVVILAPGAYRAQWIEVWHPKAVYNPSNYIGCLEVREVVPGRFTEMDGGYMAARTSVLEYLYRIGRQAKISIIREILPQYIYPVGNWQIRQTVAHALNKGAVLKNPSEKELRDFISKATAIPLEAIEKAIEFIYESKKKTLDTWFTHQTT